MYIFKTYVTTSMVIFNSLQVALIVFPSDWDLFLGGEWFTFWEFGIVWQLLFCLVKPVRGLCEPRLPYEAVSPTQFLLYQCFDTEFDLP